MDKETEQKLSDELKEKLTEMLKAEYTRGLMVGSKAMCHNILNIINGNKFKTFGNKLMEIKRYCIVTLGLNFNPEYKTEEKKEDTENNTEEVKEEKEQDT
jgi:hypothetical protein